MCAAVNERPVYVILTYVGVTLHFRCGILCEPAFEGTHDTLLHAYLACKPLQHSCDPLHFIHFLFCAVTGCVQNTCLHRSGIGTVALKQ
jgi:hypothetical protein